jgi:hypothetical protein
MTRTLKILIIMATVAASFLFLGTDNLYAIGNFSIGANSGATYDPNNMESEIDLYNLAVKGYKEAGLCSKAEYINIPYSFLAGCNLKYQFNYILFRIGGQFTKTGAGVKGSFVPTSTGIKNEIRISTYQAAFPLTIAFLLPVKDRTYFYMGGGMTYYNAFIKITQSNPEATCPMPIRGSSTGLERRMRYYGNFPGWHFIIGAEVPIYSNYTMSVEWMHQEGHSYPLTNDGLDNSGAKTNSPKRVINAKGDFLLFGVNYYISI